MQVEKGTRKGGGMGWEGCTDGSNGNGANQILADSPLVPGLALM